jgi:legumain
MHVTGGQYRRSADGSSEKREARKQLAEELARRSRVDSSVEMIGGRLFGSEEGPRVLNAARPLGQPLVDDWDCLKSMVSTWCVYLREIRNVFGTAIS